MWRLYAIRFQRFKINGLCIYLFADFLPTFFTAGQKEVKKMKVSFLSNIIRFQNKILKLCIYFGQFCTGLDRNPSYSVCVIYSREGPMNPVPLVILFVFRMFGFFSKLTCCKIGESNGPLWTEMYKEFLIVI